jgi:tRNA1(Val) A37 N6-methylase TrmN6
LKYIQPKFYHFSEDSIQLCDFAVDDYGDNHNIVIADFGAGSGVVGIEFALKNKNVSEIYFIEYQEAFIPALTENIKRLPKSIKTHIIKSKFSEVEISQKIDVALSNPPYFEKGNGRKSINENKQNCRTFEIDSLDILLEKMHMCLKGGGRSYVILRSLVENDELKLAKKINNALIYTNRIS